MDERVVKNMVFRHFLQFLLNISESMNDREKFVMNVFIENLIARVLKKIHQNRFKGSEVMVKKVVKIGCPSTFLRISREISKIEQKLS